MEYKVDDGVVDITKQYADSDYDIVVTGLEEIAISEKYNVVGGSAGDFGHHHFQHEGS